MSFNEQRENLVGRKEELIRDTSAIEQLVQSLDSQKVIIEQRESLKIDSDFKALDML